ncbi:MAG TPA: RNA polymerase sigma factor [Candidatus Limnocylindria bacterium]|jgi:RNA polymerase sigma-70 factor (ECF subfamily)|nr:RNA polymerase sigma factor [Candidatus Limnocylindria bacterium]
MEAEPSSDSPSGAASLPGVFGELYEAHHQQVYYLALRLLGDPTLAEDAAQEVFIKAWKGLDRFRGGSELRTWLYRITLNHCSTLRQSWHARKMHVTDDGEIDESTVGVSESPLRQLEVSELGERIQRTLDDLPEEYRVLLLLVADEELSYDQVAQLTNQSSDAVRGKLHRARKAFVQRFGKNA